MNTSYTEENQAHWLLAKLGKTVLRPGGKELTLKLVHSLGISTGENVLEFAPGMGATAALLLKQHPKSYTAVEANENAAKNLQKKFIGKNVHVIIGNAAQSCQENESKDKVLGEAMLTMQADHRKSEIIREAYRILRKGGLYGIHELCLQPEGLDENTKADIQKNLALAMHVNARPLTAAEWTALFEKEGFKVKEVLFSPMHLLEFKRLIADEGVFRSLKIWFNILIYRNARKRVLEMRHLFRKYQPHINAISIIAEKI
ncbi:class I SAM-dependent methyltransferase [Arachidicoccus sp.]|uniref:class I SAM-dependent methyltransferase n=1 Tax=Arachidicoccus sp. TaxID=1872624 RepID=UPI003D1DC86B